ncbi:MAG: molybdopterin-dependent oxidoreductase [Desulfovibrionaceae bacterium]
MSIIRTTCTRHCGNGCGLLVERRANGLHVKGDPEHPVTHGFVCAKTARFGERLFAPDRVTTPLIRGDGELREASWDEALTLAAERIQALCSCPERMLHIFYVASYGVLFRASPYLFGRLGAADTSGDYCLDAGIEASRLDFGTLDQPGFENLHAARHIVNWGRNMDAGAMICGRFVAEARRRGARVLAVSPGDKGFRAHAEHVVVIRPGTDRFLALAVLKLLAEQGVLPDLSGRFYGHGDFVNIMQAWSLDRLLEACGVSLEDAQRVAEAYGDGPTATLIGRGLQRYAHGGENVRCIDALALLTGNVGETGNGVYFSRGDIGHIDYSWHERPAPAPRRFPMHDLAGSLRAAERAGEPVELVWIEGTNTVTMSPNSRALAQALERPFVIAVEPFLNDTALVADLILPPALMWEWEDVTRCSVHDYVHHSAQVLDPPRGCLSNFEISRQVALRLDPPLDFPSSEQVLRRALDAPNLCTDLDDLRERTWLESRPRSLPWQGMRSAHADGLFRLPEALHSEPAAPEGYPLRLLSLGRKEYLLSQIPEDVQLDGPERAFVAPECFAVAGLDRSRPVFLATELGRLEVRLKDLPGLHPDAVLVGRGGWMKCGRGLNALIGPHEGDLAGQCAYYAQFCRLEN